MRSLSIVRLCDVTPSPTVMLTLGSAGFVYSSLCFGVRKRVGFGETGVMSPPHTDTHPVIVLQVSGQKRWRVWRRPHAFPITETQRLGLGKDADSVPHFAALGEPIIDVVLKPSDILEEYTKPALPSVSITVGLGVTSHNLTMDKLLICAHPPPGLRGALAEAAEGTARILQHAVGDYERLHQSVSRIEEELRKNKNRDPD
eukprot:gene19049-32486_t